MKIRSITLGNVRRFTDPVTIGPIGDGVTLLCEPNEAGKSTLFDALHALFFHPHRAKNAEVRALQPHSGGKVTVECEIERDGASWRIRKNWLSGASAKIWRDDTLTHQDDAAEDWLAALVSGDAGGPGGLLWVRQGQVRLSEDGKYGKADQKGPEHEERRAFLTAVSGAMDAVTGGERMDRARAQVATELGQLQTPTGKAYKEGRWKAAQNEVSDLEDREAKLAADVERLHDDLQARRAGKDRLTELEDPELAGNRRAELTAAETALQEAEGLARDLESARTEARLADQEARAQREAAERADAVRQEALTAAKQRDDATAEHGAARAKADEARTAHEAAKTALATARDARRQAEDRLRAIDRAEAAARAGKDRANLSDQIEKAEAAEAARIDAAALVERGPDEATVKRIDRLARKLEALKAARDAAAPRVSARYAEGAGPVRLGGIPLEEGDTRALPADGLIEIPDVGHLKIRTASADNGTDLADADDALSDALADGGWLDLAALHDAARARMEAERAANLATERRDTLAPDGIEALKQARAALGDADGTTDVDLPTREDAEAALADLTSEEARAEAEDGRLGQIAQGALVALAKTEEALNSAERRHEKAEREVSALPADDPHDRAAGLAELDRLAREKAERVNRLSEKAPDIDALRAHRDRRKAVIDAAEAEATGLRVEIGKLDGRIEANVSEGAEETLAETRAQLVAARDTLARVTFEVAVLRRLSAALDQAQQAAHETYFRPIMDELRPLLTDLWEDAELTWSGDTLLPEKLVRRGTEEDIDVLSGGTQEQIAFLVRLAFARLLAKSGRPTPLILDDALVYSDDDRIEKMFDALHRAAGDLQIIVLSCRQRAFSNLGAPSLSFRAEEEA